MTMGRRRDVDVARGRARVSSRPVESPLPAPSPATPDRQLARAVEAERTLREITSELAGLRDPAAVLEQVVRAAGRLVRADGAILSRYDPADGLLHWGVDDGVRDRFDPAYVATLTLEVGVGLTGRAVAERRVLYCGEDLIDAFPRVPESDHFFEVSGFRSLLAAPIASAAELYGALEVYATREHAFDEADAALLEAFAAQAAIAFENARLIAELEKARREAARRADEERTLREISGRVTAIADPVEVLQAIVHEARRLLASDVAAISLNRPLAGQFVFSVPVMEPDPADEGVPDGRPFDDLPGLWGRALAAGGPVATGDYLADDTFIHDPVSDARVARDGLRSAAAAPIRGDPRPLGSLQVASALPGAFGPHELELLGALANQAASAIATALRVADLAASRAELAKRAEVERTLREISARVSASHDLDVVVGLAIEEATRLVGGDLARVDVYEPAIGLLRGVYTSDAVQPTAEQWPESVGDRSDQGLSGQAYTRGTTTWTGDYLADDSFPHGEGADSYVRNVGIRSGISAPLVGEGGPFGALTVLAARPDAFGPQEADLLEAIAAQVAISLANARLIDDLDRSRTELARSAERERTLREIGGRLAAVGQPEELLRRIVGEARRLIGADGSRIDLLDESTMRLRWALADGATADADARLLREGGLEMGEGVAGRAAAEGRAVRTGDYLADPSIRPGTGSARFIEETGVRSVLSTPLPGFGRPLGTLSVLAYRADAFSEADADLLDAFAAQASIAIMNSRRMQALARATEENARRAATEKALREIAGRIGELRDPAEIVQLTVDEAARLLGADGARIDIAGGEGLALRRQLGEIVSHEDFRLDYDGSEWEDSPGISGTAILLGRAHGTGDYLEDRSFARRPEQDEGIRRLGVHSVLAAPIRGLEGPIGALTVLSRARHAFDLDATATLEALAGLTAAALRNAVLIERVTASEERLRDLLATSPDLIWEADAAGNLTYIEGLAREMLGIPARELVGRHFSDTVYPDPASQAASWELWAASKREPTRIHTARFSLRHADGSEVPIENVAVPRVVDGVFVGSRGAARDIRERARLEAELRESEERYRDLVQTSPDGVWQADAGGTFTFWSDTAAQLTGFGPEAILGRHWSVVVGSHATEPAFGAWQRLEDGSGSAIRVRLDLVRRTGEDLPAEIAAVPVIRDGRFAGAHGSIRDLRDQLRLERELRYQAGALASSEERAHLARELHDSVTQALFSMGLITRSVEVLLERDAAAAKAKLGDLRELQRDALAEMRSLVFELRPGSLEREGLANALGTHVAAVEGRLGLPIVLDVADVRLPLPTEDALYRIAQEALHNIVKHARAGTVHIELTRDGDDVALRIADDGIGFDPLEVPDGHLGLAGMRSRAERLGGRLVVRSAPGKGTEIQVAIPVTGGDA